MLSWRGKFLLLAIVYLSGFATAVYCLAPPANIPRETLAASQSNLGSTASDRLIQTLGVALQKAKELGKDLVDRASVLVQYRYSQKPSTVESDKP